MKVNGLKHKDLVVDGQRMYTAVDDPQMSGGVVTLELDGPAQVYAFTFG